MTRWIALTLLLTSFAAAAATPAPKPAEPPAVEAKPVDPYAADQELQVLKDEVLTLNRDLLVLKEDLLFPASSQVSVFVSMDVGQLFKLDSVKLKLDDQVIATHMYTPSELEALTRGGVHQLWIGNLPTGDHKLVAFFSGVGPNGRDYRRAADLELNKEYGPKILELRISDLARKLQPEFLVREWD